MGPTGTDAWLRRLRQLAQRIGVRAHSRPLWVQRRWNMNGASLRVGSAPASVQHLTLPSIVDGSRCAAD